MAESQQQRGMGPVFILSDDSERTQGEDAQSSNIQAGKAVAESVRTTLGPKGMDKMLVGSTGDVVITNDGVTILDEMDIEHPSAQMLVEVAETQEDEVGDGTTTAAVLAGQLLSEAEDLLDQDVHPTTIAEGYAAAQELAIEAIEDATIDEDLDDELLTRVATSSMTGKGTGDVNAETLADIIVDAVRHVRNKDGVSRDDVKVQTQTGAASSATELVDGIVLEEEPIHDDMPRNLEDVTVALTNRKIEKKETEIDAEYNIDSADKLGAALDAEAAEFEELADHLDEMGVDLLVGTKGIEDTVGSLLASRGILAVEAVSKDNAKSIGRATGANLVPEATELTDEDLGEAETVDVEQYGEDDLLFVRGGTEAESVTVFVRGGTEHVADELERAVGDALDVVAAALDRGGVVPGAGATEIAIADAVRDGAAGVEGRAQLATEAFAEAVDVLPRTLAANSGMDPIDSLVDLRSAHEAGDAAGVIATGQTGEITDAIEAGVIDPAAVKREAIKSATEAAQLIVRIDDVISADND